AVGQLKTSLLLINQAGEPVENPFLSLETELWNKAQKRVTLLFDPGRIKRGVGPNGEAGSPLKDGERYRLKISGAMSSAQGVTLGHDISLTFRVGPAERRRIDPQDWQIEVPESHTSRPISVMFDRIMDSAIVNRLLSLQDSNGNIVVGHSEGDGGGWSLTPDIPWKSGTYFLKISPDIEDVSGNTIRAPLDAMLGPTENSGDSLLLPIVI
ncbi:MAG: Ig-like domain-containing protein, partial [Pseudomonadota bacterium]